MRYPVTTEAPRSGIRATTSTGPGLDRPSMAPWTPGYRPVWASALDADHRVWPTRCSSPRVIRRSGRFGRGGVLRSRPLVTGDSVATNHHAQPLPICSAGRITARSRRGVVEAGLVTLALAARDQRLRNRPSAALSWTLLKGREPGGTPKGNRNLGNGRRGRTGERRTKGNQRKAGEGGESGGQTGNRRKARRRTGGREVRPQTTR